MRGIHILKTGITSLNTDALVNAANEGLWNGGGVCGIIFKAAGANELQAACNAIGGCKTGSAVITPGFNLKSKYIIHAVGPQWKDGKHNEPKLLYSAYKQSLLLAKKYGCSSIGFPLISAGIFGYPVDQAWHKAIQACMDFLKDNPDANIDIQFAVIDDKVLAIGQKKLAELGKENTTLLLKQLDKDGYEQIRQKLSQEYKLLIDKKAHPMAGGLMDVICDPNIIDNVSADQMIKIIESIFPQNVVEESWIARYCDCLLRVIDENKKGKNDTRAARYEKHLREVLVPALKAGCQSNDVIGDLEPLTDAYKVVVCLYQYYTKGQKFSFHADRLSIDELNKAILDIKGIGNQVLDLVLIPVKAEDKQYALFLSWILEEILIKDENQKVSDELWI